MPLDAELGRVCAMGPVLPVRVASLQEGDTAGCAFPNLSPRAVTEAAVVCLSLGSLQAKSEKGFLTSPGEAWEGMRGTE